MWVSVHTPRWERRDTVLYTNELSSDSELPPTRMKEIQPVFLHSIAWGCISDSKASLSTQALWRSFCGYKWFVQSIPSWNQPPSSSPHGPTGLNPCHVSPGSLVGEPHVYCLVNHKAIPSEVLPYAGYSGILLKESIDTSLPAHSLGESLFHLGESFSPQTLYPMAIPEACLQLSGWLLSSRM